MMMADGWRAWGVIADVFTAFGTIGIAYVAGRVRQTVDRLEKDVSGLLERERQRELVRAAD